MGKGTITFSDRDDGSVHVNIEFDPPLDLVNDSGTNAQMCLLDKWAKLERLSDEEAEEDELEDDEP